MNPTGLPDLERLAALERRVDDPAVAGDWCAIRDAALRAMERTPALERCLLISAWALSANTCLRRVSGVLIAHAPDLVGSPTVLRALADDSSDSVREEAARAAHAMAEHCPQLCRRVLRRLRHDPHPSVRNAAGGTDAPR